MIAPHGLKQSCEIPPDLSLRNWDPMKIFAKTEYACIAILELALKYATREPVRIREIAEPHGIPARFLVQILLQLKGAGLVTSTRGAAGGYQLARPPEKIHLGDVLTAIEGGETLALSSTGKTPATRVLQKTWSDLMEKEKKLLAGVTFAKLVERCQSDQNEMYYI
jgi:Rrf2 family protein